ncbi:GtrA family protein [Salinicoccus siamensis]|uniref:GtrA family protein n=1 Tax=Salinicoccus siamensis TaxID=381830 RepID=A0ABV5Z5M2_9STAP
MEQNSDINEVLRFIFVGLINTINYYALYILLVKMGAPYLAAHLTGFAVAFIISYFLNCRYVYKVRPTLAKFLKFPLSQVFNMGLQTALLYLFVESFGWSEPFAPLPVLIITVPFTYIVTRWILKG